MTASRQPGPGTPARADACPDPVPGQVILLPWHLTDYLADGLNVTGLLNGRPAVFGRASWKARAGRHNEG
jgi:hypothetical protein